MPSGRNVEEYRDKYDDDDDDNDDYNSATPSAINAMRHTAASGEDDRDEDRQQDMHTITTHGRCLTEEQPFSSLLITYSLVHSLTH